MNPPDLVDPARVARAELRVARAELLGMCFGEHPTPAQRGHLPEEVLLLACHLAISLLRLQESTAIVLDSWPEALRFVEYLLGHPLYSKPEPGGPR